MYCRDHAFRASTAATSVGFPLGGVMCWPSVRRLQGSCRGLVLRACSVFVVACESTESGPTAALAHISGCTIQREEIRARSADLRPGTRSISGSSGALGCEVHTSSL